MRRILITLGLLLVATSPGVAEEELHWARPMFDHTSHDFGVVARGQIVEHRFPLENIYMEDVCVGPVHSSCTCITAEVKKDRLKMYEKGEILAVVDTRKFLGRKEATFRVKFTCRAKDGLLSDEVQLHSYVYIRSDVVLQPGTVQLGSVPHGTSVPAKKVSISYAGRDDWKIVRAECDNPHLDVKLVETGRQAGQVSYDLSVGLKASAPVGYIRDHVLLVTNDRNENATRVLVPVEGAVTAAVSATPSPLMLGVLNPGQEVERTLMVRGDKPFRVVGASGPNDQFRFKFGDEAKKLHVVPVTFTAGNKPGTISGEISIKTDSPGAELLTVKFHGRVVAPSP